MKTMIALIASGLALVAAPAATAQKGQKQPGNLSINASASLVKFGSPVTLSGKLSGPNPNGRNVTVEEDPFPVGDFTDLASVVTNAQGEWSFLHRPAVNTRYRARQGGNESQIETVNVRPAISLRVSDSRPNAGQRVRFSGRLCPEHDGGSLALQRRRADGSWRTVRSMTLAADASTCSTYSRQLRVRRDGVYRSYFRGDADHAAGPSPRRRINVS
jgi:hypothetical protein